MNTWTAYQKNFETCKVNLVCFAYAGGSASYFAPWNRMMPEDFGLTPILYPMREKKIMEEMPETISKLAEKIAVEGKELFEKPFIVYSHCTGSLIAYETVKFLGEKYQIYPLLFVTSSEPSPRKTLVNPKVKEMSDEEFLEYVISLGLIDKSYVGNKDFMDYYFPIFKTDFLLHQCYQPESKAERLNCPIIALRGNGDTLSSDEIIKDWKSYTDDFKFLKFDGDHFFINQYAKDILELIEQKYRSILK